MQYSKKMLIIAASAGAIGAAGIGASALAASSNGNSSYPSIVQKIASTFGLDPSKVNDVFKQQRQENMQKRQARLKNNLDQAVKDGNLTQDQETKLITELDTLHSQLKFDNKTDRHQNRQDLKKQLDQWAKDNGINNLDQILPHPGPGMQHMDKDSDANDSGSNSSTSAN